MGIFQRGLNYLRRYRLTNSLRKLLFLILNIPGYFIHLIRRVRFYFFTQCWVDRIMGKVHVNGLGNNVQIAKGAIFYGQNIVEINENARLHIGSHFTLSYGALLACHKFISIGNHVMIGEYTSVRDTTHSYTDPTLPYCSQPDASAEIRIGNNVWIGRGCIILPGTIIEDGVIIGANSVVKGHLQAYSLFAGSPARLLRVLKEPEELVKLTEITQIVFNKFFKNADYPSGKQ